LRDHRTPPPRHRGAFRGEAAPAATKEQGPNASRLIAPSATRYSGGVRQVWGFKLDTGGGERLRFSDAEFIVRASADLTGGAFTIIEEVDPLDTPLHVHKNEDELWYVLEGEHIIQVGDDEFHVGPGEIAFGPRGVPHSQRRVVPRTGRFLVLVSPPGFEGFFRELSEAESSGASMPDAYVRVSEKYAITWLDQ
jgi:mannose-6-phosphate isomerase-like protein (cupin superfamily)